MLFWGVSDFIEAGGGELFLGVSDFIERGGGCALGFLIL